MELQPPERDLFNPISALNATYKKDTQQVFGLSTKEVNLATCHDN